ncbi:MAG: hypothetical protein ISR75_03275 [Phycisphaerales bacterium]|nr:hypothetical protein [Planctomycetota bacterium]MBL6997443.1 hypothetical protein [Phycisphaerales bacterium]
MNKSKKWVLLVSLCVFGVFLGATQDKPGQASCESNQLQMEFKALETNGVHIRYTLLDLNDELQGFIKFKGIVSLEGSSQSA